MLNVVSTYSKIFFFIIDISKISLNYSDGAKTFQSTLLKLPDHLYVLTGEEKIKYNMEICSIMSSYLLPADKDGNGKVECFQLWRQISKKFLVAFKLVASVCIWKVELVSV